MELANQIKLETSGFDRILGQEDTNLQDALETLNKHAHGGGFLHRKAGYYHGPVISGALSTLAVLANTIYYVPFVVEDPLILSEIGIYVTSAVGLSNARLGIYTSDNGTPATLLLDAGVVSTAALNIRVIVITQALQLNQLYWLAALFSHTPTVKAVPADSVIHHMGYGANIAGRVQGYIESRAYGSGFPATSTPSANINPEPMIVVRW